jgi:hypothetical protein
VYQADKEVPEVVQAMHHCGDKYNFYDSLENQLFVQQNFFDAYVKEYSKIQTLHPDP